MIARWVAVLALLLSHAAMAQGDPLDLAAQAQAQGDFQTALHLLRPLADAGDAVAQNRLGFLYDSGRGVPQDLAEAVKWYRRAADQGDDDAQDKLGIMYRLGRGVPQDDAEAALWFRRAADQGNGHAQGNLGEMYANGQGVPQDYVQAHLWCSLAISRLPSGKMERQLAIEERDRVSAKMTPAQLVEAHRLERQLNAK
jgi:uncharacterized protein